jgi:hypothetical protein
LDWHPLILSRSGLDWFFHPRGSDSQGKEAMRRGRPVHSNELIWKFFALPNVKFAPKVKDVCEGNSVFDPTTWG